MKIVYLGSGKFGIECLNALAGSKHTIELIVTQPTKAAGRGQKATPTAVAQWAAEKGIPFVEAENINATEIVEKIASYKPDLSIVIAFGQKLSAEIINLAPKGMINVHASLLPKYRGAAPINWAIINGEKHTGVTIQKVVEKMDAGDIILQVETQIETDETAGHLHDRLASLSPQALIEAVNKIDDGSVVYIKQDASKVTWAPKLKKSDGWLDFSGKADAIASRIFGLSPWPGAHADYVSKETGKITRVTIEKAHRVEAVDAKLPPGTLDENLNVTCGENAVKIIRLRPANGTSQDFKAFINGRATRPGDMFKKIEE